MSLGSKVGTFCVFLQEYQGQAVERRGLCFQVVDDEIAAQSRSICKAAVSIFGTRAAPLQHVLVSLSLA